MVWATARGSKFRDGKKAIESARRACELTDWQELPFVATLACAYAEAGDFDNAVKYQERILEADPQWQEGVEHLKLFQDHIPIRE